MTRRKLPESPLVPIIGFAVIVAILLLIAAIGYFSGSWTTMD
jgi:hypothetical protein